LFITEFEIAMERQSKSDMPSIETEPECGHTEFSVVTGTLAYKYLTNLVETVKEKYDKIGCEVYAISNDFFGESVTVSGLITGRDIITQLKGKTLGSRLLIPQNMLRDMGASRNETDDDVFLDDVSVSDLSDALGVPVRIVKQDGADLLKAILECMDIRPSF